MDVPMGVAKGLPADPPGPEDLPFLGCCRPPQARIGVLATPLDVPRSSEARYFIYLPAIHQKTGKLDFA